MMSWHGEVCVHQDTDNYANLLTGLATIGKYEGGKLVLLKLGLMLGLNADALCFSRVTTYSTSTCLATKAGKEQSTS